MKKIITTLLCLLTLTTYASTIEVEVLSAQVGLKDWHNKKTLCLSVVRFPNNGHKFGIIEAIEDCFYARMAKRASNRKLRLKLSDLEKIQDNEILDHLHSIDEQLEFYFSNGE